MKHFQRRFLGCLLILLIVTSYSGTLRAHVEHSAEEAAIGLDQKLGQFVPLDLSFNDEEGKPVALRELIHTPTILAMVYYHCPNVCNFLLQNVADVINRLPAEPGADYTVLAISFDEREKADFAKEKKAFYLQMIERPFPNTAWRFMTGDRETIRKLGDAVGFHFKRVGEDFEHPVTLIILSREGKIVRYLLGTEVLPLDLKMGLIEASQGKIGPMINKVVRFCFRYDPKGQKLVFNTLKVTGTVTLCFAFSLIVFLLVKGKKQSPSQEEP